MRHEFSAAFDPVRRGERTFLSHKVAPGLLVALLFFFIGSSQLLLWRFLDVMPGWLYLAGILFLGLLCHQLRQATATMWRDADGPTVATLLTCVAAATGLFLIGGEGRMFYSNVDWQVRDAVIRDMAIHPWPFVYMARGAPDVLRAGVAMFFAPALAFKGIGPAAGDWALLVQNVFLLASLLALASGLFQSPRERLLALAVFLGFSGLDIVGELSMHGLHDHIEGWAGVQFSSTVTLAFWAPQHALAAWIGATLFLLWNGNRLPPGVLFAAMPLIALWSPLGMIGNLPFAALAALTALWRRRFTLRDLLLPAGVTLLAFPSLLYLGAANHEVGLRLLPIRPAKFVMFEALEALPYLVPLAYCASRLRQDRAVVAVAAACLFLAPLIQIGWSVDFTMRASVPALTILAALTAKLLLQPRNMELGFMKVWLAVVLCGGAATWGSEVLRAFAHPPSPRVRCSFFKAWDQSFSRYPKGSHLAPLSEMPSLVRPRSPVRVDAAEPARCWDGDWYRPTGI